jgi:hypothetical protein
MAYIGKHTNKWLANQNTRYSMKLKYLKTIQQAVELGTTLSLSWFRGHPKTFNELTPSVFRPKITRLEESDFLFEGRKNVEFSIIEEFKRRAPSLQSNLPEHSDHLSWLFLMQHHGAPTRLLDWSESILVALYFAVNSHNNDDGEIWGLYPQKLNELSSIPGTPTRNNRILQFLGSEPLYGAPENIAKDLGIEIPKYPLAIQAQMNFPRIINQQGAFTIHPKPKQGCTLPEILGEERHLVRYLIPSGNKDKLRKDLAALGVTRVTLFQNLDSLSETIIEEHHIVGYSPPVPPNW